MFHAYIQKISKGKQAVEDEKMLYRKTERVVDSIHWPKYHFLSKVPNAVNTILYLPHVLGYTSLLLRETLHQALTIELVTHTIKSQHICMA